MCVSQDGNKKAANGKPAGLMGERCVTLETTVASAFVPPNT